MALKITLKPHERMIIGGAVVTNGDSRTQLVIENKVPLLREKDILSEREVKTPARRIYFVIQLMYVDEENLMSHHQLYWNLVEELVRAAPSVVTLVDQISEHILFGRYYRALKIAQQLMEYEEEVVNATEPVGSLSSNRESDRIRPRNRGRRTNQSGHETEGMPKELEC
jgi:flagellar protein FlbT